MRGRNLLILVAAVLLLGGYILFFERHQPTSDEAREQADRVFPDLEQDSVEGLEIATSHGRLRLERRGSDWQIIEPIDFPADSGAVSSLLRSVVDLSSERRLEAGGVDLAAYALDQPRLSVAMTTTDGSEYLLLIGDEAALGSLRAVTVGDGLVLMCPGWFVTDLDKTLDQWRDRDVVDLFADQVVSLELVEGQDRVAIARSGELWRLLEPVDDLADRDHVQSLISDLNAMRIEAFPAPGEGAEELGLAEPRARITVLRSDQRPPFVLELGDEREVDGSSRIACRRNGHDLLLVDNRAKTALDRAPVRWRSRRVFPFDSWNVEGFRVARGDTTFSLERAAGSWHDAAGAEVDNGEVLDRLSRLAELEATAFDLIPPEDAAMATVTIELGNPPNGAPSPVTFIVHRPLTAGGEAIVQVSGRPGAMGVSAAAVEAIVADLDALTAAGDGDHLDAQAS